MSKKKTPLRIFKLLDQSNCAKCGYNSCLEFSTKLIERKTDLENCPHLKYPEQISNFYKIKQILLPPQWTVNFGKSTQPCIIGGEEVLYRHERTFFNETAIAIEIHDSMKKEEIFDIINYLNNLKISRIGEELEINAVAIRYTSNKQENYINIVKEIAEKSKYPMILCCWSSEVMEKLIPSVHNYKPLLYAANPENKEEFAKIAIKYKLPLACYANTLEKLHSLVQYLVNKGLQDIVIDPGTYFGKDLLNLTYNNFQTIRHQLFNDDIKSWGFPLMGVPAAVWSQLDINSEKNVEKGSTEYHKIQYKELLMAALMESIDVNLIILHTGRYKEDIWGLLGLMTYRQNIFTDPREYPRVDPELVEIGTPNEWSPIYITSNYRMTKIPVEQDLIDAGLDGYLLVVDTEGIGIESATAGGQFNEDKIKKSLDEYDMFSKVSHRKVILPGMAARLKKPLEIIADIEVLVGPRDSSAIPGFIKKKWKVEAPKES